MRLQKKIDRYSRFTLETYLLSKEDVQIAIQDSKAKIQGEMQLTEQQRSRLSSDLVITRPEFPPLFDIRPEPESGEVTAETISKIMFEVDSRGDKWLGAMRTHSIDGATTAFEDAIAPVLETAGNFSAASNGKTPFLMVGDTNAGKSYVTDSVSRVSECDRTQYGKKERNNGSGPEPLLEAEDYLSGLPPVDLHAEENSNQNASSELDSRVYKADPEALGIFINETHLQKEREAEDDIRAYCEGTDRFKFLSFLLPSGKMDGSTTATSIALRRASRYQLVIEYRAIHEVLALWMTYEHAKKNKLQNVKKLIMDEVKLAFGLGTNDEKKGTEILEVHNTQTSAF